MPRVKPWPVRAADVDHPDELRIDLGPAPEIPFADVRDVALVLKEVLDEHGLTGWPKTSGKRGMHVLVRVVPEWEFTDVRRAALAIVREVDDEARGRNHRVVERRACRSIPRLQSERARTYG